MKLLWSFVQVLGAAAAQDHHRPVRRAARRSPRRRHRGREPVPGLVPRGMPHRWMLIGIVAGAVLGLGAKRAGGAGRARQGRGRLRRRVGGVPRRPDLPAPAVHAGGAADLLGAGHRRSPSSIRGRSAASACGPSAYTALVSTMAVVHRPGPGHVGSAPGAGDTRELLALAAEPRRGPAADQGREGRRHHRHRVTMIPTNPIAAAAQRRHARPHRLLAGVRRRPGHGADAATPRGCARRSTASTTS